MKIIENALCLEELNRLRQERSKTLLKNFWYDAPFSKEYQLKLLEYASDFVDTSDTIGAEEWSHNPFLSPLPEGHYDKDEYLFETTGELVFPLCSCILYLTVKDLKGGDLIVEGERVVPETNKLILLKPGTWHEVTEYIGGSRVGLYLNFWDRVINIT